MLNTMKLKKTEEFVKSFLVTVTIVLTLVMQSISAEKASESKVRIGILNLENAQNEKESTDKLTFELSEIVKEIGFYEIFNQDIINDALKKVNERMPLHCRDPRCVLDIGKTLSMDRMLFGSIDFNDKRVGIKLTLIDVVMSQTIGSVSLLGDPGSTPGDVMKAAVAKLHGNQAADTVHLDKYFGPEVHNEKQFILSTAGFIGAGLLYGAVNYVVDGNNPNHLVAEYQDEDLSGIPSSADQIPIFARPAALGNAYTAVSDDAYGVFYNPAGIAWVAGPEAALGYQYRFGMNVMAASYVNKASREVGFGHAILYCADPDDIFREIYFVSSMAYKFNELLPMLRPLSVGVNVKIASNRVQGTGVGSVSGCSFGAGIDLGLVLELSDQIRYGLTLRDLPVVNKWKNVSTGERYFEANAATLLMGGSFRVGYTTFLVADGQIPLSDDQPWKMAGGIEQEVFRVIFLRAGMQKEIETTAKTFWKVTGGFGIKLLPAQLDVSYEYNTIRVFDVINVSFKFNFK
jgi:hypothetical protein